MGKNKEMKVDFGYTDWGPNNQGLRSSNGQNYLRMSFHSDGLVHWENTRIDNNHISICEYIPLGK